MSLTIPTFTTSTNLGPLITQTSFPSDCLANLYDFNTFGLGLPWTYETQGCALSTCCPSGNFHTGGFAWLTSYYSPGVCPESYTACPLPTPYTDWSTISKESIALCCPSNYECAGGAPAICQSLLATSTNVVVLNNIFDQQIISTRPWTLPSSLQAEDYSSYQIAYPLQIRWKASDFAPATAPSSPISTQGGTSIAANTGAQASSGFKKTMSSTTSLTQISSGAATATSPPSSSSALSNGSLAGIITGVVSAVVGIAGLGFKIYKWKYPKKPFVVNEAVDDGQRTTSHA